MVWIPLSNFLFYGFYQSLTYKRVKKEGVHAILFSLVNHYGLVWGSPDKPGGLSIQLCKSEKKEFYIRYSS